MTTPAPIQDSTTVVTSYRVTGLTCGHCVSAVIEELSALDGVSAVSVSLSPGATSTVTVNGATRLRDSLVVAALQEAGDYRLVDAAG